ncbi:cold shock domain protein 2-like protein [Oryza sativa Japonica Group]|uniref:Cold shock domain protein 2-like protein n=1 Tax=Oryza sativa subsp. japonica TaxID=39947 RepID=Q5JKD6_ORYSJ|nr:cold shock domain protein 2-like protein [Oryza sativa Japonica Group]
MVSERVKGMVKGFDATNGFSFITPDDGSEDLFIHQSSLKFDGYRSLNDDDVIELSVGSSDDGRTKAVDVTAPGSDAHTGGSRPSCGHIPTAGRPLVQPSPLWPQACIELSRRSSTPSTLHRCSPLLGPQPRAAHHRCLPSAVSSLLSTINRPSSSSPPALKEDLGKEAIASDARELKCKYAATLDGRVSQSTWSEVQVLWISMSHLNKIVNPNVDFSRSCT